MEDQLVHRCAFPKGSSTSFEPHNANVCEFICSDPSVTHAYFSSHGVNTAEGASSEGRFVRRATDVSSLALKSEALAWRFTGDPTDVESTFERIDLVYKYHGRASGMPHQPLRQFEPTHVLLILRYLLR
jgi:hypothetical protein